MKTTALILAIIVAILVIGSSTRQKEKEDIKDYRENQRE